MAVGHAPRPSVAVRLVRLVLLWAAVAGATQLTGPSAVAASRLGSTGFQHRVLQDACDGGIIQFKVSWAAGSSTSADRLTIDSYAQRVIDGKWRTVSAWPRQTYRFAITGRGHSMWRWNQYACPTRHRILMVLAAWHKQKLLAHRSVHSAAC